MTILDIAIFGCLTAFFLMTVSLVRKGRTSPAFEQPQPGLVSLPSIIVSPPTKSKRDSKRLDHWLQMTLMQAAIPLPAPIVLLGAICLAIVAGVVTNLANLPLLAQFLAVSLVFLSIPVILLVIRKRRINKFVAQFPATIELISRAVGAGESFEAALKLAATTAEEPVKRELLWCVKQFEMGMPFSAVMNEITTRMPTLDTRIFAHTVSVHHEMGGRLASTLERMSRVITVRNEYIKKLKSLTSMARFSILAISFLGVVVLLYMSLANPEYATKLLESSLGKKMLAYAVISELVGIAWILLTLKSDH